MLVVKSGELSGGNPSTHLGAAQTIIAADGF